MPKVLEPNPVAAGLLNADWPNGDAVLPKYFKNKCWPAVQMSFFREI